MAPISSTPAFSREEVGLFLLPAVAFVVVAPIDFDRSNSIDEMLAPR